MRLERGAIGASTLLHRSAKQLLSREGARWGAIVLGEHISDRPESMGPTDATPNQQEARPTSHVEELPPD